MRLRTGLAALALLALAVPAAAQDKAAPAKRPAGVEDKKPPKDPAVAGPAGEKGGPPVKVMPKGEPAGEPKGEPKGLGEPKGPASQPLEVEVEKLREARKDVAKARKESREQEKAKLAKRLAKATPNAVPPAALKQELERHARRLARLTRVGELATEAKDAASIALVSELVDKENSRHERWMTKRLGADDATVPAMPAPRTLTPGGTP